MASPIGAPVPWLQLLASPRPPFTAGCRPFRCSLTGRRRLYLIADYDTAEEAQDSLEEVYETIVEAELEYWHRDTGTWPAERTYAVFRQWFDVLVYPLIQDLVDDELTATEVDEAFIDSMRKALEALDQQS